MKTFTFRATKYLDAMNKERTCIDFPCPACKDLGKIDEETGLCRACWRVLALLGEALKDAAKEMAGK